MNYRSQRQMAHGAQGMSEEQRRRRRIRNWLILVLVVVLAVLALYFLRNTGGTTKMTASQMPCWASQDVTPFGDSVLYYDGASVHCLSATGAVKWSFPVGMGASFSVSGTHAVIWRGATLYIVDKNGAPTYNETLSSDIQFARIGSAYAAAVIGDDTHPDLVVKDLNGNQIDEEIEAFSGLMMLDVGFFGDQGQYMWTLCIDLYGTALNSVLNTFQVGRTNSGEANLGDKLVYKVLWENNKLRVFSTQQMYTFDYKAVRDVNNTMLVYGWNLIDAWIPQRGDAVLLLAPNNQTGSSTKVSDLRVLSGNTDLRYTLPDNCIGAAVRERSVYAFSTRWIYRANISDQRFYAYAMPLPDGLEVTSFLGTTSNGYALLGCGETVYSVSLPQ